ncbi:hypothetical protein ACFX13_022473 [Malus domestica]
MQLQRDSFSGYPVWRRKWINRSNTHNYNRFEAKLEPPTNNSLDSRAARIRKTWKHSDKTRFETNHEGNLKLKQDENIFRQATEKTGKSAKKEKRNMIYTPIT